MNKNEVRINIQNEVNENFKSVWTTKKPNNVLKGGRNSFKSSVIALLLVYMIIGYISSGKKANVAIVRKVGNTIRDSVYNQVLWALDKFFVNHEFTATVAPFRIKHRVTGSTFYFYGQDDFAKLKSNKIEDLIAVWYEEAAEFSNEEEFDQTNITFMRQKHPDADFVRFFWSYNPPRNPYAWINEWADKLVDEPTYLVHSSTYLDDKLGFITQQMMDDIERIKRNDYDYYRYVYLGEPVGLGTNIYNMSLLQPLKELPEGERVVYTMLSTDSGHQVSATTTLFVGYTNKRNVVLLDTMYYSPDKQAIKKAPSELSVMMKQFRDKCVEEFKSKELYVELIDSAEGALRNQYFLDFNIRLHPIAKQRKVVMIDYVQELLAQGRFYYLDTPNNQIFVEEHKQYQWNEKTIHTDNPEPIKENDHTCDAFQYLCTHMARQWRLRV